MLTDVPKARLTALPKPTIYDTTRLSDERTQTLKRLLDEGHAAVAPLREPNLQFHTHLPHVSRTGASLVLVQALTSSSCLALHIDLELQASNCKPRMTKRHRN